MPSKKSGRGGTRRKTQPSAAVVNLTDSSLIDNCINENPSASSLKRTCRKKSNRTTNGESRTKLNGESTRHQTKRYKKKVINVSKEKKEQILSSSVRKKSELECNFCDFEATSSFHLKVHMEVKHTDNMQYYACSMCSFTISSKRELDIHLRGAHKKSRWKCRACDDLPFKNTEMLLEHINTHHNGSVN